MSNVQISATGEVGLSVAVNLGPNERATHLCPAGETVNLTVGGNQTLHIEAVDDAPTAEVSQDVPVGVDVPTEAPDYTADSPIEAGIAGSNPFTDD